MGLALWTLLSSTGLHATELRDFGSKADEERYKDLIAELRCMVCQNQSLADSDAPLAKDLRDEVYEMFSAGQSNVEITDFLVARYGDFVLYRPPVKSETIVLWAGPFVLLLVVVIGVAIYLRRRTPVTNIAALSDDERERLNRALNDTDREDRN
ncbi:MAG: cytochrome c-type biogenesis protein CcmH [Chromatiales bacterium]|nr:cytochrome c-type biogenesis protein CcmH [Chromatiales bacterium]